jgi:hypothetical protein
VLTNSGERLRDAANPATDKNVYLHTKEPGDINVTARAGTKIELEKMANIQMGKRYSNIFITHEYSNIRGSPNQNLYVRVNVRTHALHNESALLVIVDPHAAPSTSTNADSA